MRGSIVCWLLIPLAYALGDGVAIIGAGIGGCSTAYYIRKFGGTDENSVDIFEARDYIGGRLKHTQIEGHTVELGGDAWSTAANHYVVQLVKELGINTSLSTLRSSSTPLGGPGRFPDIARLQDPVSASLGIWNGSQLLAFKDLVLQHPISDVKGAMEEADFIAHLDRNYAAREMRRPFQTIEEFLQPGGLDALTSISSANYFKARHISQATQSDLVEPLVRVIYDQGLEAHAFATLVSLTSVVGAASVSDGNSKLVEALARHSGASVHLQTAVQRITKLASGSFLIDTLQNGKPKQFKANHVVLASPIEFASIEFVGLPVAKSLQHRQFKHWFVTVVRAAGLNRRYFNVQEGEAVPHSILTTASSVPTTPFNVVQLETSFAQNDNLYKIFSNVDVSSQVSALFTNGTVVVTQVWPYTFPKLEPVSQNSTSSYQPIRLDDEFYYLNTMESVASAMEGSVIAGRNVAQILMQRSRSP